VTEIKIWIIKTFCSSITFFIKIQLITWLVNINYTVKVEKPGYYKIKGIISSEYKAANKNGEISIISAHGNHLRSTSALKEDDVITTFGFPKTTVCADLTATDSTYWNCWAESDAISGDNKEVLCVFDKAPLWFDMGKGFIICIYIKSFISYLNLFKDVSFRNDFLYKWCFY
jgi:hypothetical protein